MTYKFHEPSIKKLVNNYFSFFKGLWIFIFILFLFQNIVNAQVCVTSGLDGPQNAVPPVNTYFPLSTSTTLVAGNKTITLLAVPPNDPNYNLSYGVTPIR